MTDRRYFDLDAERIKLTRILSKKFLEIEMDIISDDDPNRNGSHFMVPAMEAVVNEGRLNDTPVLGYFDIKGDDFTSHDGSWKKDTETGVEFWDTEGGEQILGIVRERDNKQVVEKGGKKWIVVTCGLFTQYKYRQVKKLLKDRHKKVSVEIDVKKSYYDDRGVEQIEDFDVTGITILGSRKGKPVQEGIENAHLSVLDTVDPSIFAKQRQALSFAYKELDGEPNDKITEEANQMAENISNTEGIQSEAVASVECFDANATTASVANSTESFEATENVAEIQPEGNQENFENMADEACNDVEDVAENNGSNENECKFNEGEAPNVVHCEDGEDNDENEVDGDDNGEDGEGCDCNHGCNCEQNNQPEGVTETGVDVVENQCQNNECDCGDSLQMNNGECTNYEAMYNELNEKYEALSAEYNEKCAHFEEVEKQLSEKEESYTLMVEKYSDYESVKEELCALKRAVFERDCKEMSEKAEYMMLNENIDRELKTSIVDRCRVGEIKTFDELKTTIAIAVYDASHSNQEYKHFSAPIDGSFEIPAAEAPKKKRAIDKLKEQSKNANQ